MPAIDLHVTKSYAASIGHIEARDGRFLVSLYRGRGRVGQQWAETLEAARFALRRMAGGR